MGRNQRAAAPQPAICIIFCYSSNSKSTQLAIKTTGRKTMATATSAISVALEHNQQHNQQQQHEQLQQRRRNNWFHNCSTIFYVTRDTTNTNYAVSQPWQQQYQRPLTAAASTTKRDTTISHPGEHQQ
jgi:hypothetical protein